MVICAYGNCEVELEPKSGFKLTITESSCGSVVDRQSFCCYAHGASWLQDRAARLQRAAGHGGSPEKARFNMYAIKEHGPLLDDDADERGSEG